MLYAQEPRTIDWTADLVPDPVDFTYQRRYGVGARDPALTTVARSWERSLGPPPDFGDGLRQAIAAKAAALDTGPTPGVDSVPRTSFSPMWHLLHPFFDVPPFRYVAERFQPKSVLDVGCGLGASLLLFRALGAERILGVDGFPWRYSLLEQEAYREQDLNGPLELGETFDLVTCIEVAEHLVPGSEQVFLSGIARHAKEAILFSAAEEGQPGEGHINCRPIVDWLERWHALGWTPDPFASLAFRALSTFSWLRRNPVLLRRISRSRDTAHPSRSHLRAIGRLPFRWYSQELQIIDSAFGEDPPGNLYE
jgi:SAM-dependent methyltransferase